MRSGGFCWRCCVLALQHQRRGLGILSRCGFVLLPFLSQSLGMILCLLRQLIAGFDLFWSGRAGRLEGNGIGRANLVAVQRVASIHRSLRPARGKQACAG